MPKSSAGADDHPAVPRCLDFRELGGRAAVVLDVGGHTEPAELASGLARGAPRREACPVRQLERAIEVPPELARGHHGAARRRPREFSGPHQVPPAELDPVNAGLARRRLDQALGEVVRLDAPDSAEGGERRGVGEHAPDGRMAARDAIRAAERGREVVHHHPDVAARQIGAVAPVDARAHRRESAVAVEGQLAAQHVIARLVIGQERLRALGRPLDGSPQPPGGNQEQRVLRVHAPAGPEATAGVGHDDAQPLGPDPHHVDENGAHAVGRLASHPERPAGCARVVLRDGGARLHEHRGDPVVDDLHARDVRGAGERRLDVAGVALPLERHVARPIVPDAGRIHGERLLEADRRRPRLVVDADQRGRVVGLARRVGDDEHDRLSGVARRLPGEGKLVRIGGHRPIGASDVEGRRARVRGNRPGDFTLDVDRRQHQPDSRRGARRGRVDGPDARVRVGRAHHHRVELPGQRDVVGEARCAGQEARILLALPRRADPGVIVHVCRQPALSPATWFPG
jgi:hypothetical protein